LNLWLRYISEARAANGRGLTAFPVPAFTTLDARLAWRLGEELELAIAGQNLLEEQHLEYVPESFILPTEVQRTFSASLNWGF
jgi:iron complex outermembrane receptor protein